MQPFAIEVTLKLFAGKAGEFLPLIRANARGALRDEPDCLDFRIFQSRDDPDTIVLFEVYTRPEALDFHRGTPHYRGFAASAGPLIAVKEIRELHAVAV